MKKVLIIEDDKKIAELERDYLEAGRYEVDIAHAGDEGLDKALKIEYDLVILDLMLPFVDGFEVCRKISAQKDIPILMVTAKSENVDKIRGLGLGAADYMVKPFEPSELVARVDAHIKRYEKLVSKGMNGQNEIVVGGLRVEKNARRVFLNGKELNFPNKEFDLLYHLITNPNIVFSKEVLFDRIWGMDAMGDTSTVPVHINRIRDKIEKDTANPQYIETVWGAGYRFKL